LSLPKHTPNHLISESSPYLLQHAYNPVDWRPFSEDVFALAKSLNKPVLISVGYSACHWCHVMEKECFEDEEVAGLMNRNFINVKVDREERADVDMLYMQAVQLMTGHGGWPLNCFVLPDGRPFYGGTYFPKKQWMHILTVLSDLYTNKNEKVIEYANELTKGIQHTSLVRELPDTKKPVKLLIKQSVDKWKERLDNTEGGPDKAPKFPMPNNYRFLLRYAILENDEQLLKHVRLTLTKMAFGGIYDHVHGGFARYSVGADWKVPHFEKMLYDNAQLVSLYTEAYLLTGDVHFKQTACQTIDFVLREWRHADGGFYSAYDADSDGEEGKYYVWTDAELRSLLKRDYAVFSRYFEINERGYWENDNYILMRSGNVATICSDLQLTRDQVEETVKTCLLRLRKAAAHRTRPGLDDKTITSWNAMMCSALAQAHLAFGNPEYKTAAIAAIEFLTGMMGRDNKLFRIYKKGQVKIQGFLDDYAFLIDALLNCYLVSADMKYLEQAKSMTEYTIAHFSHWDGVLFYYTSNMNHQLITRQSEMADNVIPASNSQMAHNLFMLAEYYGNEHWRERARQMLSVVLDDMKEYGSAYSNWALLGLNFSWPFRQIAIVGKNVEEKFGDLYKHGVTNAIFALSRRTTDLPLLKGKYEQGRTLIYVCQNNTCGAPVTRVQRAIDQLA
jgi:uncharacterized protein